MPRYIYTLTTCLFMLLIWTASAQDFSCITNADGVTATITGYSGAGGDVTLPDSINGLTVTVVGTNAFSSNTNIIDLTINNAAISIGSQAFLDSSVLTNVFLGSGVTNIGWAAFAKIGPLLNISVDPANPDYSSTNGVLFSADRDILIQCPGGMTGNYTVPTGVTCIGSNAFYYCLGIGGVTLPDSVTNIQSHAFDDCSLTNIDLGTNLVIIGDFAFSFCRDLTNIVLPSGLVTIGVGGFQQAHFRSVQIPDSVTSVGSDAFGSSWLVNVYFGSGITNIGASAFNGSSSLLNACFNGTNPPTLGLGAFFSTGCTIYYPLGASGWGTTLGSVPTMPWDPASQCSCTNIAGTVTLLAYLGISNSVIIPDAISGFPVTALGAEVFTGRTSLTNVVLPAGLQSIGFGAFYRCSSLQSIALPPGLANIGYAAFEYCSSLVSITLPAGATNFGGGWNFTYCTNLTSLFFLGNAPAPGESMLYDTPHLTIYYLPNTSGWTNYYDGHPAVLWNPQALTTDPLFGVHSNDFGFTITGASNLVLVVEACTNLSNPTWLPVGTNTLTNGASYFSDQGWTNSPTRLYRFRSP